MEQHDPVSRNISPILPGTANGTAIDDLPLAEIVKSPGLALMRALSNTLSPGTALLDMNNQNTPFQAANKGIIAKSQTDTTMPHNRRDAGCVPFQYRDQKPRSVSRLRLGSVQRGRGWFSAKPFRSIPLACAG